MSRASRRPRAAFGAGYRPERGGQDDERELSGRKVRMKNPPEDECDENGQAAGDTLPDAPADGISDAEKFDRVPGQARVFVREKSDRQKERKKPRRVFEDKALIGGAIGIRIAARKPTACGLPVDVKVLVIEHGVVKSALDRAQGQRDEKHVTKDS